jgi:uncharacterized RDD family membrane protein YckC
MNPPTNCLECGTPLQASDAGGLCPKCLLRLGLASQLASGTLPASAVGLTPNGSVIEPFDFGGYRILRLLGKGGMGAVYEAEQRSTGRVVALKVLGQTLDTPEMRQRFLREGQLAAAVRHPNSVAVLSAEEIDGAPVIAMELVSEGTLRDRVKASGPLPIAEAVDAVLQIIDGLEAAHAGGVLHRDVKPANCFFTNDGSVKVGDFGLSISTLVKAEQQLTQPGAVLGTPAFASPEQLRAQEIDVRSDIYSVGATLYFLATGKPTHDAETLVALIAAVLERDPVDPQVLRPDLPSALSRVIMRCLARNPATRFGSYQELRAALMPFRSAALQPAPLGLRFLAGMIDGIVISIPWMLIISQSNIDAPTGFLIHRTFASFLPLLWMWLWEIAAVNLPEARWGAGLGKALCGLRVVKLNGDVPGLQRSLSRWAIFAAISYLHVPLILLNSTGAESLQRWIENGFLWEELIPFLLFPLLFVTMRRRNGFAAVQDLLTGTRVVISPAPADARPMPVQARPLPIEGASRIGVFAKVADLREDLVLGYDDSLKRYVWIRLLPAGVPPVPSTRRDLGRAGRLRWLAGARGEQGNWDAYEAPAGRPLSELFDRKQSWAVVRSWLYDIAEELRVGLDTQALPREVSTDWLWLTDDGRVVLLDFPVPGAGASPTWELNDQRDAQRFLWEVAKLTVGPRIPIHAAEFLRALEAGRFESIALTAGNLRASIERPATVSLQRRLISVGVPAVIALLCALLSVRTETIELAEFDRAWLGHFPGIESPWELVQVHNNSTRPDVRGHCLTILAARYSQTVDAEEFWNKAKEHGYTGAEIRRLIESAAEALPKATEAEAKQAEEKLKPALENYRRETRFSPLVTPILTMNIMLSFGGIIGMGWVLITGAPPLLYLNHGAIVRRNGKIASKLRVLFRMALTWLPVTIGWLVMAVAETSADSDLVTSIAVGGAALLMTALAATYAVKRPERGPQDWIAGTWLIPR